MSGELFRSSAPDMSCQLNYNKGKTDTMRLDPDSIFFDGKPLDYSEEFIGKNGFIAVYAPIKNKKVRAIVALSNHLDGFYKYLIDIYAQISIKAVNENNLEVLTSISQHNTTTGLKYRIEFNSIEGSENTYQYIASTYRVGESEVFFSVEGMIEISEKENKIICKDQKVTLGKEVAGYLELGTEKTIYKYEGEISYSFGAEKSNFEESWENEKKALLAKLAAYKSEEKRKDFLEKMTKLQNYVREYMSKMAVSLEKNTEGVEEKNIENAVARIKKNNNEFIYEIKLKLKQLYPSKKTKLKIDQDFDPHLIKLQIKATQPFVDKAIANIGRDAEKFYAVTKEKIEKIGKMEDEVVLGELLKCQLIKKSNDFYEKIETNSSESIKNSFQMLSDDFDETIENSGLRVPEETWKPVFDYVSHSLSEIGFSSAASIVDSISLFIFGRTKHEIAKKGCEVIKTVSAELKDLPKTFSVM